MSTANLAYQIEPMPHWPYRETARGQRQANRFRASYDDTLRLLSDELKMIGTTGAVAIRVVADAADVRKDGMLRTRALVRHSGVAVSFTCRYGALTYPCDTFFDGRMSHPDWQANLRAIALGLEKLRALNRYGIAGHGEQYRGWAAIESGSPSGPVFTPGMTMTQAREFLLSIVPSARGLSDVAITRAAIRQAHPDNGGDAATFMRVVAARTALLGVSNGA